MWNVRPRGLNGILFGIAFVIDKVANSVGYTHQRSKRQNDDSVRRHGPKQAFQIDIAVGFFIQPNQIAIRSLKRLPALIVGFEE